MGIAYGVYGLPSLPLNLQKWQCPAPDPPEVAAEAAEPPEQAVQRPLEVQVRKA